MSRADPFAVSYVMTEDWLALMRDARTLVGWGPFLFQIAACSSLFAIATLLVGGLAASGAKALEAERDLILMAAVAGGLLGIWAVRRWAVRVAGSAAEPVGEIYTIGGEMSYQLDASGFRMTGDGLDWHTSWRHLRKLRRTQKALVFITPFSVFAMPVAQLPVPVEDAMSRIETWRAEARR